MIEYKNDKIQEKYYVEVLENGLTVYLYPKKDFYKTYAIFSTKYGSQDIEFTPIDLENSINTPEGIAHFLEHKLFENEDGTDASTLFAKTGADVNAFTTANQTAYLFSATNSINDNIELLLDFVQEPCFKKASIDKERGIIEQELLMYLDQPQSVLYFGLLKSLYKKNNVRNEIGGSVESIKQINEYERGIKFKLGKFSKIMNPGWNLVLPIFESYKKVDIRTKAVDVPEQDAITKDNVSIRINAVIYYKIFDASKSILEVENFYYAVSQLAQTTMRNIVGSVTLDELLSERETISTKICEVIDEATDPWGIKVENVELKDVSLPEEMKRVIAKVAEAEREKAAVITKAAGEVEASSNLAKAAEVMNKTPGALHLRTLATLNDLSSDQSNTVIFALPVEVLRAFESASNKNNK